MRSSLFTILMLAGATANAQQTLPSIDVEGGISIRKEFYESVFDQVNTQNQGRLFAETYGEFDVIESALGAGFDAAVDVLDLANLGIDAGIASLCATYPEVCTNPYALAAITFIGFLCDGLHLEFTVETVPESAHGGFVWSAAEFTTPPGNHVFDVTLTDVGMWFMVDAEVSFGGDCDLYGDRLKGRFVFDELEYRVTVDLTTPIPQVTADLTSDLSMASATVGIEGLSIDASFIFQAINWIEATVPGLDVSLGMDTWASTEVPVKLAGAFEDWWTPYIPHQGSILDLSRSNQSASYGENGVLSVIDPPVYTERTTTSDGSRVRTRFIQGQGAASSDPQVVGTNVAFAPSSVEANFAFEADDAEGTYYLNLEGLQQVLKAGVLSGVGLRDDDKDGGLNPLRVEYGFDQLTPEHGGLSIDALLGTIPVTAPDPPIPAILEPVPLSPQQLADLTAIPLPSGFTGDDIGELSLNNLVLSIEIREKERNVEFFPFDGFAQMSPPQDPYALVWHQLELSVEISSLGAAVLSETFDAMMGSRVVFAHDRELDTHSLYGVQTGLLSLVNENGLPWNLIGGDVPNEPNATDAPVSFLMRALLGARATNSAFVDDHFYYLVEGLAGPLAERSVQDFLRLPGLDFPSFAVGGIGWTESAQALFEGCEVGLGVAIPAHCARFDRWGSRPGINGAGAAEGIMFSMEVDWSPVPPIAGTVLQTRVTAATFPSLTASAFPSLSDRGYVRFEYGPSAAGDQSRVLNASGYRSGPYLRGGGSHYVAATAASYRQLRQDFAIVADPTASIELVPYRGLQGDTCPLPFQNPVKSGTDDAGTDFEVWTFESTVSCDRAKCDGTRVGLLWTAPLFEPCGEMEAQGFYEFVSNIVPAREGPDSYTLQPEVGCDPDVTSGPTSGPAGQID